MTSNVWLLIAVGIAVVLAEAICLMGCLLVYLIAAALKPDDERRKLLARIEQHRRNYARWHSALDALGVDDAVSVQSRYIMVACALAEHYNTASDQMLEAIYSALIGDTEPMRRIGLWVGKPQTVDAEHALRLLGELEAHAEDIGAQ